MTCQLTGVDGKTCLDGKESNTESLTRTIKMRLTKVITLRVSILRQTSFPSVSPPNNGSVKSVTPTICFLQNCESRRDQNNVEEVCDENYCRAPFEQILNAFSPQFVRFKCCEPLSHISKNSSLCLGSRL